MRDAVRPTYWEIAARLDADHAVAAGQLLLGLHPADQADVLAELTPDERQALLELMDSEQIASILEFFNADELSVVTEAIEPQQLAAVLAESPADVAADVIHTLEEETAEAVLEAMADTSRVEPLLEHEDESAGGIMAPEMVTLRPSMTADNAIDYLRSVRPESAEPYYLYVVDDEGRLLGHVGLRDLITVRGDTPVSQFMSEVTHAVTTDTDQEEVLQMLQHFNLQALPVLDAEGRLAGVATAQDLIDVAQQEATEDMFRMVGLSEEETPRASVAEAVRRRLPWLTLNIATAFIAAATVSMFEDTIARVAALAIFLPVVAGQGGNAGTQVLTLSVRAMALGQLDGRMARALIPREAVIGLINGVVLGVIVGAVGWAWQDNGWLGIAVGMAMIGNMVVAGLAGMLVPLGLRAARVDPALASSIFVTTVTDVMGFFLFLGIAALLIDRIA